MADFTYVSWNVKQMNERIELTPLERDAGLASTNATNNTRVSKMLADIVNKELAADILGVMEGVKDLISATAASAALKSALGARWTYEVSELSVTVTKVARIGDKERLAKADRYLVFWKIKGQSAQVSQLALAEADYSPVGAKRKRDFEDRVPLSFLVNSNKKKALVFLWHAPQKNYTNGAITIERLATWIREQEKAYGCTAVLASGDFNLNTGVAAHFTPLTTDSSMQGLFDGAKTTLGKDTTSRYNKFAISGSLDHACLNNAYDNVYIKGMVCSNQALINLCAWAMVLMKKDNNVTTPMVTRAWFNDAMRLGNLISDHCPIGVSVKIQ